MIYRGKCPPKVLRSHLGPLTEHTRFDAEAVGVALGLQLLSEERNITSVSLYIDNQSVISFTKLRKPRYGQHTVDNSIQVAVELSRVHGEDVRLELRWISAHGGVEGNERIDRRTPRQMGLVAS